MSEKEIPQQNNGPLGNYVFALRKHAGLRRRELAQLLGYGSESAVLRHEKSQGIPPLLMALGYSVVFKKPIEELFPGLHETVERTMEARLLRFENELQEKIDKGDRDQEIARTLAWLYERHDTYES